MVEILVLAVTGFVAGVLNSVAGGGTFLTFPALVWAGLPPVAANATATFAALPGYLGGAWGFRHDIRSEGALKLWQIIALSLVGSVTGALLLLVTPSDVFDGLVPVLLLVATGLFAFGPRLLATLRARGMGATGPGLSAALVFVVAVYGGYFNGGLGILLLALFGLIGFTNLNTMNGLKVLLSGLMAVLSCAAFAIAGLIGWYEGLIMAAACTLGGWIGAGLARRMPVAVLRALIVVIGLGMAVVFFLR
ncbi:MAG: hypothetical protein BGP11_08940 [Rhodobacterales bacterium 65-51]|jgi:uncharacterized membrane protein YfcA|uniref:sulfite exporter TauE/SafE family protein n=1 Tax=uncultured Gemmobacter sp. TaxID=1095917 RepID=UPI0009687D9B|nr:sulfite exporter TauE/SafE family protein [uncultured Gemmobacter sp.]OJY31707.1 MAG: hypothetical protein BGP11_08940 [Rhodobacterales bacterium 65-51]